MTEPDNDRPLHEVVRQKLTDYQPPVNPNHWQQMRRKIRRERQKWIIWVGAGLLIISGMGWFAGDWSSKNSVTPTPTGPSAETGLAEQVVPAVGPSALKAVRPPFRELRIARKRVRKETLAGRTIARPVELLEPLPVQPLSRMRVLALPPVLIHSPAEADIIRRVLTGTIGYDSTTYRVLSRNVARWKQAVIVCDFTSSMYPYSTQLMAWFRKNQANEAITGLVFFTDCDSLGRETEPGRPGQFYTTRSRSTGQVLPLMLASARNTLGNYNEAENNLEALVYAQNQFPQAKHLVLIADNSSSVKDLDRLPDLHVPVHIILCGPTYDRTRAFQSDYVRIAQQTGGSLHTLEDDMTDVGHLVPNTWIRVAGRYYRLNRRGRFLATDFRHRPRRFLGLFWR